MSTKEDIPDLPPEVSDTSNFPSPEGYPAWVVIQQNIQEEPSASEASE